MPDSNNKPANVLAEIDDMQRLNDVRKQNADDELNHSIQVMAKQNPQLEDALKLAQLRGSWQMAYSFQHVAAAATVSTMASLLEGNRFKNLPIQDESGGFRTATSKEEFCRLVFGKTRSQCSELISDFKACNNDAELYDAYVSLGLHRDQRRLFRKLPEEAREQAISTAVEKGDKDEVLELIEAMAARHTKEKEQLDQEKKALADKVENLESERQVDQRLLEDKEKKINELERELARDLTPDQAAKKRAERDELLKSELMDKSLSSISMLNELASVTEKILDLDDRTEHLEETLYAELRGIFRHALLLGRQYDILPEQLLGLPVADLATFDRVLEGELM